MTEFTYMWLSKFGYGHPIHSPVTHVPMGMVIGGCLFVALGFLFKKPAFYRTALHCYAFALAGIPLAMFLGYMDWQHFYHGVWRKEIVAKIILATALFVVCVYNVRRLSREPADERITVAAALLSLAIAGAVGFFGGEIVYGG
jgi:uncharacterized membrane protein